MGLSFGLSLFDYISIANLFGLLFEVPGDYEESTDESSLTTVI
jgi:hypothetical protein